MSVVMSDDEFPPRGDGPRAGKNDGEVDASTEQERDQEEFEKRWEDIEFLLRKPFCCK